MRDGGSRDPGSLRVRAGRGSGGSRLAGMGGVRAGSRGGTAEMGGVRAGVARTRGVRAGPWVRVAERRGVRAVFAGAGREARSASGFAEGACDVYGKPAGRRLAGFIGWGRRRENMLALLASRPCAAHPPPRFTRGGLHSSRPVHAGSQSSQVTVLRPRVTRPRVTRECAFSRRSRRWRSLRPVRVLRAGCAGGRGARYNGGPCIVRARRPAC